MSELSATPKASLLPYWIIAVAVVALSAPTMRWSFGWWSAGDNFVYLARGVLGFGEHGFMHSNPGWRLETIDPSLRWWGHYTRLGSGAWNASVPSWLIGAVIAGIVFAAQSRRLRRLHAQACPGCGYDLAGLLGRGVTRCPECGQATA